MGASYTYKKFYVQINDVLTVKTYEAIVKGTYSKTRSSWIISGVTSKDYKLRLDMKVLNAWWRENWTTWTLDYDDDIVNIDA